MNISTVKSALKKIASHTNISSGFFLISATMFANVLNFVFNAFLGRELSAVDFGTVTLLNTVVYLTAILIASVGSAVNRETAYIQAKNGLYAGVTFFDYVKKYSWYIGLFFSLLWLVSLQPIASFFQITNVMLLFYSTPFILCGILAATYKGFMQGNFKFTILAILVSSEALIKLILAILFVSAGWYQWVGLSIPLSILSACLLAWLCATRIRRRIVEQAPAKENISLRFPRRFYTASVLAGLSSALFLSIDLILVKHYFDPTIAGQYSLLSLVGKIVFFLGSLLSIFIITLVSHDEGKGKNPHRNFYYLLTGTIVLLAITYTALVPFGFITIPLLFGARALPILPYVSTYVLATAFFTVASTIVSFHLARKQYVFPIVSLFMALVFCTGIIYFHSSVLQVIHVFLIVSVLNLTIMTILHLFQKNGQFILANCVDLMNVFYPLPQVVPVSSDGKRILMFNWRDTKHVYAGGAENYVHELAKRWVASGNAVTLFCGNDGKNKKNEVIDGVNIFRRGGTYTVYPWACIYYIFKFRGLYDVIVDSQNGVPFFTPLYAKEKVFSLLYHVHQEIFYKFLPRPLAFVGATLENRVMPMVYKNTRFITISESTKHDMENLGITREVIDIVYPGVDLDTLQPGEKSPTPLIVSVGRLKAYKSIDVLIKAFKQILGKLPNAKLIIAGDGEEKGNLQKLTRKLHLDENVEFTGKINEEEKINLFQKAWVFVNPSMMEGWGITTIEANACGTPVVASDVPGLRDSVKNPHTGFLVEYGNTQKFAEKIIEILANENLRKNMEEGSKQWAKNFSWNQQANNCLEIIL